MGAGIKDVMTGITATFILGRRYQNLESMSVILPSAPSSDIIGGGISVSL